MTDVYAALIGALAGIPVLPDAACRGRADLFDVTDAEQAAEAAAVCRQCPALDRCRAWANSLPVNSLNGVVAGQVHTWSSWARRSDRQEEPAP